MAGVLAPAGYCGKTKKAVTTKPNALRRVKFPSLFVMWILHVETELAYRHPTLAQLFAALSPTVCERLHSSPSANLESYLSRFSFGGFDGQCDTRARRYRGFRFSLQRILALRRKGKCLAATAADDERRCSEAVCGDRLSCIRNEDVECDRISGSHQFGIDAGDVQHQTSIRPLFVFLSKSRRRHRESHQDCQYESHDRSPFKRRHTGSLV